MQFYSYAFVFYRDHVGHKFATLETALKTAQVDLGKLTKASSTRKNTIQDGLHEVESAIAAESQERKRVVWYFEEGGVIL